MPTEAVTLNRSPTKQANVPAPTDDGELNNHSERKSDRVLQE